MDSNGLGAASKSATAKEVEGVEATEATLLRAAMEDAGHRMAKPLLAADLLPSPFTCFEANVVSSVRFLSFVDGHSIRNDQKKKKITDRKGRYFWSHSVVGCGLQGRGWRRRSFILKKNRRRSSTYYAEFFPMLNFRFKRRVRYMKKIGPFVKKTAYYGTSSIFL